MFRIRSLLATVVIVLGTVLVGIAIPHDAGSGCNHTHDGTQRIICNDLNNNFIGTESRDEVYGNDGADSGDALAGNDLIKGGNGSDTLKGSNGIDNIYGQNGHDRINGGNGADDLYDGNSNNPNVDTDIICAGTDSAVDFIDAIDDDFADHIYYDAGEDNAHWDFVPIGGGDAKFDQTHHADQCPINE